MQHWVVRATDALAIRRLPLGLNLTHIPPLQAKEHRAAMQLLPHVVAGVLDDGVRNALLVRVICR